VAAVRALAPAFGAVNLEDIAAPACFEVERRLRDALSIPVIHDDQHGTAVVVLAALINAGRVTGRELAEARVVIVGAGGPVSDLARGADVIIGRSVPDAFSVDDVAAMNDDARGRRGGAAAGGPGSV
jgi:malic enzyme